MSIIFSVRNGRRNETTLRNDGTVVKKSLVPEKLRRCRLQREKWALEIAKEKNINVPTVFNYYIENDVEILVTERITGTELTYLSEERQRRDARTVAKQVRSLSGISKNFGWPSPDTLQGEFESWNAFLQYFLNNYGTNLLGRKILPEAALQKLKKVLNRMKPELTYSNLVHRDIKTGNIISNDDGCWVLDWENALLGDPLFDPAAHAANFGREHVWQSIMEAHEISAENELYMLYEAILLIGAIDFLDKEKLPYDDRLKQALDLISIL